jgi:hypothetical protein
MAAHMANLKAAIGIANHVPRMLEAVCRPHAANGVGTRPDVGFDFLASFPDQKFHAAGSCSTGISTSFAGGTSSGRTHKSGRVSEAGIAPFEK